MRIDQPIISGSAVISGSLTVTGSIIATLGITGSLFGTASNATSASYYASSGSITAIIDGNGGVITTGQKGGYATIPYNGTIYGWTVTSTDGTTGALLTGSIIVDAWKDTYANFPPTVADSIFTASGNYPTLVSASKATSGSLNIPITQGDLIGFNVISSSLCVLVSVELKTIKTS